MGCFTVLLGICALLSLSGSSRPLPLYVLSTRPEHSDRARPEHSESPSDHDSLLAVSAVDEVNASIEDPVNAEHLSNISTDHPTVFVAVISSMNPEFLEKRQRMRKMFRSEPGNRDLVDTGSMLVRYLVGKNGLSAQEKRLFDEEQKAFGDMVALNCGDDYEHLTDKTMAMIQYSAQYFPDALLTWKIDDDSYVGLRGLAQRMDAWPKQCPDVDLEWFYWGNLQDKSTTSSWNKKWAVSTADFPFGFFEPFMNGGTTYLLGRKVVQELAKLDQVELHQQKQWVRLEDASLGMWVGRVNQKLSSEIVMPDSAKRTCLLEGRPLVARNAWPILYIDFQGATKPYECVSGEVMVAPNQSWVGKGDAFANCLWENFSMRSCCIQADGASSGTDVSNHSMFNVALWLVVFGIVIAVLVVRSALFDGFGRPQLEEKKVISALVGGSPPRECKESLQRFEAGDTVLFSGLRSRPDLVGLSGQVIAFDPDFSRYTVTVDSGEQVKVREMNLRSADSEDSLGSPSGKGRARLD